METKSRPVTSQETGRFIDTGFVVEDRTDGLPVYYDANPRHSGGSYGWATKKEDALQFHRRIDGERFIAKHLSWAVGQATVVPV